jgi:FlaA1/EpsC-like NDP-sugar epimerase
MDRLFEKGIDYVFHLAALKHVPICENYPQEAIKTNIIGTTNVVNAAIRHGVKKFIDVSTDKAVSPTNLYGMTKSVGEKVSLQANCLTQDTAFICIRGGNVLGTNGSVVPYIIDQIKNMNKVEITDPGMTRFFLTLPQAIELLYKASLWGRGGETFVMRMPSFYIIYLVELLVNHYGNEDTQVNEIGMKEGEKIHEVLISEHECKRTHQIDDDYYVIYPQIDTGRTYNITLPKFPYVSFSSADNLKDINYLKNMLEAGGFLR